MVTEEVLPPALLPPLPLLTLSRELLHLFVSLHMESWVTLTALQAGLVLQIHTAVNACTGLRRCQMPQGAYSTNPEIPPASRKQIFPPKGICSCLILLLLLGRKSQRTRVNLKKAISTSTCSWAPDCNTPAPYQGGYRCCQDFGKMLSREWRFEKP